MVSSIVAYLTWQSRCCVRHQIFITLLFAFYFLLSLFRCFHAFSVQFIHLKHVKRTLEHWILINRINFIVHTYIRKNFNKNYKLSYMFHSTLLIPLILSLANSEDKLFRLERMFQEYPVDIITVVSVIFIWSPQIV